MMRRSFTGATFAVAALAALAGCKQPVLCPALGSCGGPRDPATGHSQLPVSPVKTTQEWALAAGHPSCTEDLYIPANDTRLPGAPQPTTGMPYPEPAVFDWCILLVTGPGAGEDIRVKPPRFYYESGQIGVVALKYSPDGHFSAGITRTGTFYLDFPAYCISAFGAKGGILDPTQPMDMQQTVDVCKRLEVPVAASGLGEGSYRNTTCRLNTAQARDEWGLEGPADPKGCICRFDVTETGGPSGAYSLLNDNTLVHIPGSNFPQKATFCQQGDRLQLTGTDGAYLFDQAGVRTFDLVRACATDATCTSRHCNGATTNPVCTPCSMDSDCLSGTCSGGTCASCVDTGKCSAGACDALTGTCTSCKDNPMCASGTCNPDLQICI
jgi:hypothetical protein